VLALPWAADVRLEEVDEESSPPLLLCTIKPTKKAHHTCRLPVSLRSHIAEDPYLILLL
jgi:hypothetical protein